MNIDFEQLKDWRDEARKGLRQEADRLEEKGRQISSYMQVLDAMGELISEIDDLKEELERKQDEVDDLIEQLAQKEKVIDDLQRQLQAETGDLRQQLLDAKEQTLEAEANSKPPEIHNHFEWGSSAQVFNDKVTNKYSKKKKKWKKRTGKMW